ncbi:uncharacterized protein B0I36DRAFT_331014 [Microdochium trichocladiopsis]|uniref:Uncharacterized protein n=1 Tax=Microdochium trichocladiopsis TaxID=1682393 RepID=A0A9P8Y3R4_9PEZI|nr:uncharacterized protein B0I36DRAFT_331014 [Microdochium trichocladiopsis]KAH7026618.1 hypothetical protein B0I36DRAFT_331014 [Microdochium trichocladiopsis]
MVVRTPSLHGVKRTLLPSIHQPLPLSKRQSQQLLDTITTSFRKNLDLEHPWQSPDSNHTTSASSNQRSPDAAPTKASAHAGARPTDQHLRSILANPLFAQPAHDNVVASRTETTTIPNQLYIFDAAVAKGLMNNHRAFGFLVTILKALEESSDPTYNMANTGAGLRVLQWLRATNQEANMRFLAKPGFVSVLIRFLFAEGLEHVAWEWLARIASPSFTHLDSEDVSAKMSHHPLSRLFSAMMNENRPPANDSARSIDPGLTNYLAAHEILSNQSRIAQANLRNSWAVLSWQATVEAWKRVAPTTTIFEDFVESGRPWKRDLDLAHLDLHHPTSPRSEAALSYMHQNPTLAFSNEGTRAHDFKRQRVICLALDAVDRLKQAGNADEVSWVERFLTTISEHLHFGTADGLHRETSTLPLGRPNRYASLA